jgi:hypothetical protein
MDKLRETLQVFARRTAVEEAGRALREVAEERVANVAIDRAPMKDGILRGTIETLAPEVGDGVVSVRVVCGGPSAPYAIAIHEHLSEHSPPNWVKAEQSGDGVHFNVGGPKFLESALTDAAPTLLEDVASKFEIKNAWEEAT